MKAPAVRRGPFPTGGVGMAFYDKKVNGLTLHVSTLLEELGVPHAFTTRYGGVSTDVFNSLNLGLNRGDEPERVRENYRRVCEALGVEMDKLVLSSQVHEDTVRKVTLDDAGKGLDRSIDYNADGLTTNITGLTLTAFGADCLTILLYDPIKKAIANVHAGWRGTALGIVDRAVERMETEYGSRASNLVAAIGPGISRCCFETHEDVPKAMLAALGEDALEFVVSLDDGKYKVDLKGINALRLKRKGILATRIDISPDCTMCAHEKYWSHRYTQGKRGSQAALISLPGGTL